MTVKEWEKVFEMSQDKNLYHNLCTSLFPTIHGKSSFHLWHKLEIKMMIKKQQKILMLTILELKIFLKIAISDLLQHINQIKGFLADLQGVLKSFMKGQILYEST